MTDTLGLPLLEAVRLLEGDGYLVTSELVRCRKDVAGTEARVIRQLMEGERTVRLSYSTFWIPEHAKE